jgi:superfamily II DNA or RNA helicase
MNVSPDQPFEIIYSLYQFENFGYLFQSYIVQLDEQGELTLLSQNISSKNIREFAAGLDDKDYELVSLIDSYQRDVLLKKFNTKRIPAADFFSKLLDPDKGDELIRGALIDYLQKINARILAGSEGKTLYISGKDGDAAWKLVRRMPEKVSVRFHLFRNENNTHYFPSLRYAGEKLEFQYQNALLICESPAWLLIDDRLYTFDGNFDGKKLKPFFNKKFIPIAREMEEKYLQRFILPLLATHDVVAKGYEVLQESFVPKPVLTLFEAAPLEITDLFGKTVVATQGKGPDSLRIGLSFRYGNYDFKPDNFASPWHVSMTSKGDSYVLHKVARDVHFEGRILKALHAMGLNIKAGQTVQPRSELLSWISENRLRLEQEGIALTQSDSNPNVYYLGDFSIDVSITENEESDWFDVKIKVIFGAYEIPFLKLKKHILQGKKEFLLPNGEVAIIPDSWLADYSELLQLVEADHSDGIRLKKHHLTLVDTLGRDRLASVVMSRKLEKLKDFDQIGPYELPANLSGSLRPYQKSGYDWLRFLNEYHLGGCLADDMGLGKTIQTLTLLLFQKEAGATAPSLLVMPVSLLYNWASEAEKFTPTLRVLIYTGTGRDKNTEGFKNYDLILTSYGIVRLDSELLRTFAFHYVILDESQAIKNPASMTTQSVMRLEARHRLILTGTPLENSAMDLWSQMTFVNPGLLGTKAFFQKTYLNPIEKAGDEDATKALYAAIKPFILRRHKSQVAKFLPEKTESIHLSVMTDEQAEVYEKTKSKFRNLILKHIDSEGLSKSQIVLLQGLSQLRQIANHPKMVEREYSEDSGKFRDVFHKMETALSENHKILVFSSFVKHLDLFKEKFDRLHIPYAYLDGSTVKRSEEVQLFQENPDVKVFFISIKAGGVGLNLTAADYVFILDPWWNPAVEAQAIDRAHRIGQDKSVFIYKFITKNTVEEKILLLQNKKKALANELIATEEGFVKSLTREDVLALME